MLIDDLMVFLLGFILQKACFHLNFYIFIFVFHTFISPHPSYICYNVLRLTGKTAGFVRVQPLVYARHGRELMGCGSPFVEPSPLCVNPAIKKMVAKALAEGKGGAARPGPEEAGVQIHEPTNRNSIQGRFRG